MKYPRRYNIRYINIGILYERSYTLAFSKHQLWNTLQAMKSEYSRTGSKPQLGKLWNTLENIRVDRQILDYLWQVCYTLGPLLLSLENNKLKNEGR